MVITKNELEEVWGCAGHPRGRLHNLYLGSHSERLRYCNQLVLLWAREPRASLVSKPPMNDERRPYTMVTDQGAKP